LYSTSSTDEKYPHFLKRAQQQQIQQNNIENKKILEAPSQI
jgi:hypothetical protein